jgi:hypothetical protein
MGVFSIATEEFMKSVIKRNWRWMAWGVLIACLSGAQTARASALVTIQSVFAMPGEVNDVLNVYITNLGAAPLDVAEFAFEIDTTSPDITFEQATTATTLYPYVFAGNSLFGPVISTSSPGQKLDASDIAATPTSFTVVNPGASFGLGEIFFNVAPWAANQLAPVNFNTSSAFTSVSDQNGNLQPLDFAAGSINVVAPEPSTWILLVVPLAWILRTKRRL